MTAVVERAENAGKQVKPLIVPTNNPLHAVLKTAKDLQAQRARSWARRTSTPPTSSSSRSRFYWISLHDGHAGAA